MKTGILQRILESTIWRSIFRTGIPDTDLKRSMLMFNNFFLHIFPVKMKRHGLSFCYTFCLGGISFLLFIILCVTGILLMFLYTPSIERAYFDMQALALVFNGKILRNLHRWAAHGMVVTVFLHMVRVFYTHSYRPPREFNWVIGIWLFILTLALSYTGYLLPWDQLAYWGITVGTTIMSYTPFLGKHIRYFILGADEVGHEALLRFYVLHCAVIPFVALVLMAVHFWRVRKDGGISEPL
ncbi:MAG: cytochrome b N-terminal domain-containing protein [Thermodesulfobacteriota bacterium]|nr:cytochrome b N-terminal domain-containing protein [Thermodesulfobacteriota bacterium]